MKSPMIAFLSESGFLPYTCICDCTSTSALDFFSHGNLNSLLLGEIDGLFVASVHMARHANSGIVGQHALDALRHGVAAVGYDDLSSVLRVPDTHSATVVN